MGSPGWTRTTEGISRIHAATSLPSTPPYSTALHMDRRKLPPRPGFDKKSAVRQAPGALKPPNLLNSCAPRTAVSEGLARFGTASSRTSQQAADMWRRAGEQQQRNVGAGPSRFDSGTAVGSCLSRYSAPASNVSSYLSRFDPKSRSSADDRNRADLAPLIRKLTEREVALAKTVGKHKRRSMDDGEDPALAAARRGDDITT